MPIMRKFEDTEKNYLDLFGNENAIPSVTLNKSQQNELIELMQDAIAKNRPILDSDLEEFYGGSFGDDGIILSPNRTEVDFDEEKQNEEQLQDYLKRNKQ